MKAGFYNNLNLNTFNQYDKNSLWKHLGLNLFSEILILAYKR